MSGTSDSEASSTKTLPQASFEQLISPVLGPGRACLIVIRGRSVGHMVEIQQVPVVVGRAPELALQIDDSAVSRRHAEVRHGPEGFLLSDLDSTNGVFVNGVRVKRHALKDGDRIQVGSATILKFCFQDEVEANFQKTMYDSATRDSLTGLYNRKFLLDALEADFSHFRKSDAPLSLLLLDLDHFKDVNDTHGHLAGDAVIRGTAQLIQKLLRTEDVPARYGGEEFAVLLRYTDGPRAFLVAERIREGVERHRFEHEGREIRATASIGIATLEGRSYESLTELIEAADEFLYKAKQEGRNRTIYIGLARRYERLTAETLDLDTDEIVLADAEAEQGGSPVPPGRRKTRPLRKARRGRKG